MMNLRNILDAHRGAVTLKDQAVKQLQEACQDIDQVINYVVKPIFEEANRQIGDGGFDVGIEVESRMLESHSAKFRFTAACVLTAGKSIPASTLIFDGNPRTAMIEFTKVVGGLKHEEAFPICEVTEEFVEKELEMFVQEVFPSDLC